MGVAESLPIDALDDRTLMPLVYGVLPLLSGPLLWQGPRPEGVGS